MRRYVSLAAIVLTVYVLCFASGCSLLPLEDMHAHQNEHEDEGEREQPPPAPPEEHIDPDLAMHPPEVQERIKKATVDDAIEMLKTLGEDMQADSTTVTSYVYRNGSEQDRKRLEKAVGNLAQDSDVPEIRKNAISLLGGFDNSRFDLRVRAAKSDPDKGVRRTAVLTLRNDGAAAKSILQELTKDPDAEVRQVAQDMYSQLMSQIGDEGIIALVQDLGVYRNDASALASTQLVVRGAQALPYLIDAASNDSNKHRRAAATTCISMICAGNNPSLDKFAERAHSTTHEGFEPQRREANLEGLKPLLYVLQNDPYAVAREAAAQGLGYLGSAKAAPALAKALYDPNDHVRRRAAAALETVSAVGVVKQLANVAANDEVAQVRAYAVRALGNVGGPRVVEALAKATEDADAEVRQHAANELGRLRAQEALDELVKLFDDEDEDVRWAAVRAVGELRNKAATPYLVKALQDEYPQVSNAAERGLQKLGVAKRKATGFEEPTDASG